MRTSGLSEEEMPPTAASTRWRHAASLGRLEDVTAGTDGLQERELTGGGGAQGKQKAAWPRDPRGFPASATRENTRKLLNISVGWGFRPLYR